MGCPVPSSVRGHSLLGLQLEAGVPIEKTKYVFKSYGPASKGSPAPLVLLEENRDPLGQGTTGLISWQGAVFLSEWADSVGGATLEGKHVVELGSGLGLFGLSLLLRRPELVKSFTFTDCHPDVLNFLALNASLNFSAELRRNPANFADFLSEPPTVFAPCHRQFKVHGHGDPATVARLDWTECDAGDLPTADIVVASDVVYAADLVPHLVRVIEGLLRRGASAAYIACTHRNGSSLEIFLRRVVDEGMRYESVMARTFGPGDGLLVTHESLKKVVLYRIELKV